MRTSTQIPDSPEGRRVLYAAYVVPMVKKAELAGPPPQPLHRYAPIPFEEFWAHVEGYAGPNSRCSIHDVLEHLSDPLNALSRLSLLRKQQANYIGLAASVHPWVRQISVLSQE